MVRQSLFVLAALVGLAACSGEAPPPDAPVAGEPAPPPAQTVIDEQLKALEKAKAVQDTLDKAAADRNAAIDDAGG